MKVLPISTVSYSRNSVVNKKQRHNSNVSNSTDLLTPNAQYNALTFGAKVPAELKYAEDFLTQEVAPFIEKNKGLVDELKSLTDFCKDEVKEINSHKVKPKYNPDEFEEVKRLKLDRIDENQTQFENLLTRSRKWYADDDAREYAKDLIREDSFFVPSYVEPAYKAYLSMKKDIKNGLTNLSLEKLAPEIAKKKMNLSSYATYTDTNKRRFNNVVEAKRSIEKALHRPSLYDKIPERIEDAKRNMEMHQGRIVRIKDAIETGKKVIAENRLTDKDREVLANIHKPAERIINHNVKKFKENPDVANTYLGEYEPILENQLREQAQKLIRLLNKIERD